MLSPLTKKSRTVSSVTRRLGQSLALPFSPLGLLLRGANGTGAMPSFNHEAAAAAESKALRATFFELLCSRIRQFPFVMLARLVFPLTEPLFWAIVLTARVKL